jgi:RNA polymerase sigma-70 factor (ECF subfamily)
LEENTQVSEQRPASAGEIPPEPLDLAALTRRMTDGDEMAWRTFYNAYFDRLWRYLLVVSAGNEDAAREALQATLIRATRHIKIFHDENVFWSWLTVLARSAFADETKKRRRYFSFLERLTRHADVQSDFGGIEPEDTRLNHLLLQQIASLPADEKNLVEQKYLDSRSVREIAGALQTSEKAVESKLSRVRRKLKDAVLAKLKNESQTGK